MSEEEHTPRSGRVAIVGRPNVGKSTLLNALLGQKLAITTPRPGTTRTCLLGVYACDDPPTQIAFIDTPGLERPRSILGRVLVEEAQGSLEEADAVLILVDATQHGKGDDPIAVADADVVEQVKGVGRPFVVALNKVDKIRDKAALLPKLATWQERHDPAALLPISAMKKTNLAPLVARLRELLPPGRLYEDDILTDRPERFFVAELVRESIMRHTRQEVPYSAAVKIETYREELAITRIGATIVVDKASHKGIVIGAGGARLKTIGTEARKEMEQLLGRKVFLELWITVDADWTRDARKIRELTKEPG